MITVYHNPKCRKSRSGLEYVRKLDKACEVREYIREGITAGEIRTLVKMLGVSPFEIVRTQEDYYKENLKEQVTTDEQWYEILAEFPRLIRRPIVVCNGKATIADPPEKADLVIK